MRAYFFVNTALSGIQKGLQVAHCAVEMGENNPTYDEWACEHKTIIVLEGGFNKELSEIEDFFGEIIHPHPWAAFREDEDTLALAYTAVGIILPERIYEAARIAREEHYELGSSAFSIGDEQFTAWEIELIKLLNSRSLAR